MHILRISLLLLLAVSLQAQRPPNILLVLSDDHSVPYLGAYGNPDLKTPHLNQLAKEGMLFWRAYTSAPQCVPSRASLMTGRSVVDVQMGRFSSTLPREMISFPEILRDAGYYTGLCGRSYHMDGSERLAPFLYQMYREHDLQTFPDRVDYCRTGSQEEGIAQMDEFLDQIPEGKPFFLQLGFSDPHRPFTASALAPDPGKIEVPPSFPETPLLREDLAAHYGEIEHADRDMGRAMAILKERGLLNNTVVIFMGDNGAALLRGKGTLYECGLNVPLIVWWPGKVRGGTQTSALISGEDLAPTLLDLAGLKSEKRMTGRSFLPLLLDQAYEEREQVFAARVTHGHRLPDNNNAAFDLSRTVITKKYKLIYNPLWPLPYSPVDFNGSKLWKDLQKRNSEGQIAAPYTTLFAAHRPMVELYDLEKDPYEWNNLAEDPAQADLLQELVKSLSEWMILNWDYVPLPLKRGKDAVDNPVGKDRE